MYLCHFLWKNFKVFKLSYLTFRGGDGGGRVRKISYLTSYKKSLSNNDNNNNNNNNNNDNDNDDDDDDDDDDS